MKNVKLRVLTTQDKQNGYKHIQFQILDKRHANYETLEPIGTITWQQSVPDVNNYGWYGMNFEFRTDNYVHLEKMAKIAKFIADNFLKSPDEVKAGLQADEHFLFNTDFVPLSYVGHTVFKVMVNAAHYCTLYAANEVMAEKLLKKTKSHLFKNGSAIELIATEKVALNEVTKLLNKLNA